MAHMTSTVPFGESSWGATLQQYQKDRLTVPEATAKPVERQRPIDTYNQNKPVARTFNPVLMKFTNPAEERARVDKDHNSSMHRMNVAKDKQLVYEQVTSVWRPLTTPAPPPPPLAQTPSGPQLSPSLPSFLPPSATRSCPY